jgi:ABC-type transport system involved in multi-copper enzyme maturation permease subunit
LSRAPTTPRRLPAPFVAMLGYTLRACVPRRRRWLLLLPAAGAVLFGLLARVGNDPADSFQVATVGIFSLVLPLGCLVLGDAVVGAEVRSGTFSLTWLSPVRFWSIVVARWLGAWSIAVVVLVPAGVVACVAAGQGQAAAAMAVAMAAGSAAYVAVFVLFGAVTRRAAVWSIAFVLLVERLVGTALSSIAQLSPMWLARTTFDGLVFIGDYQRVRSGVPYGWSAVARLVAVTAVALVVAGRRVGRLRLAGAED